MDLRAPRRRVGWRCGPRLGVYVGLLGGLLTVPTLEAAAQADRVEHGIGAIVGFVLDTALSAIPGAEVIIHGTGRRARSDSAGRFRLTGVPVGSYVLQVRRLGISPALIPITVADGENPELEIVLEALAPTLPSVTVEPTEGVPAIGRLGGSDFAARQRMGMGSFYSRARIDSVRPTRIPELLRTARGLRVEWLPFNRVQVVSTRGGASVRTQCAVALYLDGVRVSQEVLTRLSVDQVAAVEAYAGPASTPPEFGGTTAVCGAVAIWLRHGPSVQ